MEQSKPLSLCLPLGVQIQTPTRRHGASDVEWDPAVPSCPGANSISDDESKRSPPLPKTQNPFQTLRDREYEPEFLVHSAALQYPRNNTPFEFTAMWNLTLLAMNPNKKWDIYCDSLQASLFYQHITYQDQKYQFVLLTATSLRLLLLTTTNQTLVSFKLSTLDAYVADDVANKISDGNTTDLFGLEISVSIQV
ncbi:hypothetical protein ACE6H2_021240 [Prunus campanulata]